MSLSLYLGDHARSFSFPQRGGRSDLGIKKGFDPDPQLARVGRGHSLKNIEIRAVRTYNADKPPSNPRGGAIIVRNQPFDDPAARAADDAAPGR